MLGVSEAVLGECAPLDGANESVDNLLGFTVGDDALGEEDIFGEKRRVLFLLFESCIYVYAF